MPNSVNVGTGSISISPSLVPGFHSLLQQQLNAVRPQPTITVGVNVDQRGLQGLNRQLGQTQGSALNLRNAFVGVFAALSARQAYDAYNTLGGISNRITLMTAAATSAASAVGPLLGLVGGLGAGFAVAGAGVGAFAALAKPQISAVTTATAAVSKQQDAYNAAVATGNKSGAASALKAQQAALANLTPAQRTAVQSTLQLKDAFKQQSDALAPISLGVYSQGLKLVTGLLPALTPIARAAGDALSGIFTKAQDGLSQALSPNGGLGAFLNVVKTQIGPVLTSLSGTVVNVGRTLSNVFQAAVPIMMPALDVLKQLTGSLANASGGAGLKDFFRSLVPLLQPLRQALTSIAGALGAFIKAAVPLAGPVLGAVKALGDALKQLFNSGQFQAFVNNIGNAITSLTPLFSALVGPIGTVLATISGQISQLAPLLVPVITQFAQVFSQILVGLSPLLPAFVQLAGILVSFLPILYPIIAAFRQALYPVLTAVGQVLIAIRPSIDAIVRAFVALLPPIGQMIAALAPLVGQLINALAPVLVAVLQAIQPLIPIISQVASQIAGAFVSALVILLPALVPLIAPLGRLVSALLQLFLAAIQPLLPLLPVFARLIASLVPVIVPLVNAFTWFVNLIRPIAPLLLGLVSPFFLIVGVVTLLVRIWTWAWNTIIGPSIRLTGQLIGWLWQNVAQPAFRGIAAAWQALTVAFRWYWDNYLHPVFNVLMSVARTMAYIFIAIVVAPMVLAWQGLTVAFRWAWDNILHPVWNAVAAVAGWLWNNILKPVFGAIGAVWGFLLAGMRWQWDNILHPAWNAVASVVGWLWNNILKPIFGFIGDAWHGLLTGMTWVWDHILHPMFDGLTSVVHGVRDTFDWVIKEVDRIWHGLINVFKVPVNIVIDIISGFDSAVDWVLDKINLGKPLPTLGHGLNKFAKGGLAQPGWALVGEEGPEIVNFTNPGRVYTASQTNAMIGGTDNLRWSQTVPGGTGGSWWNPVDWGKKALSAGSAVIHGVTDAASWVADQAGHLLRAGAADALDATYRTISAPLFAAFPKGLVPDWGHRSVDSLEQRVIDFIRGKEVQPDAGQWTGGRLTWPVPGHTGISQHFGHNGHPGIDIPAPLHTPIVAANTGQVVSSGPASGFGNWIRIVGEGVGTVYGHMQSGDLFAHVGDKVTKGQRIAGVGSEGESTGAHLHFEVHPGGVQNPPVDPEPYLRGTVAAGFGATPVGPAQQYAASRLGAFGWGADQMGPLVALWQKESSWNANAVNPNGGAYGIPQAYPPAWGHPYAMGDYVAQINWGLNYIKKTYGSPASAWATELRQNAYDSGGWLMPGATMAFNATGRPEPVLTGDQWDRISSLAGGSGRTGPLIGTAHIREEADADLLVSKLAWAERRDQS